MLIWTLRDTQSSPATDEDAHSDRNGDGEEDGSGDYHEEQDVNDTLGIETNMEGDDKDE